MRRVIKIYISIRRKKFYYFGMVKGEKIRAACFDTTGGWLFLKNTNAAANEIKKGRKKICQSLHKK